MIVRLRGRGFVCERETCEENALSRLRLPAGIEGDVVSGNGVPIMLSVQGASVSQMVAPEAVRCAMRAGWRIRLYTVTTLYPGLPPGAHHDASRACLANGDTAGSVGKLARDRGRVWPRRYTVLTRGRRMRR